ncbi:MAG: TraM recognition domain-containing protein, partial [Actinomycetia bacterium]|nr:TraM recognition domain-containing protein [Actinomycetes bacterium]
MDVQVLILLIVTAVGARIAWRRGARPWAFGLCVFALLALLSLLKTTHPLVLAALAVVALGWVWRRRGSTFTTVTRWGASSRRKAGVASRLDIARSAGVLAMRRQAPVVRPSLTPPNRRARAAQLASLAPTEVAVQLCRVGPQRVFCSPEDCAALIGPPRQGKPQELAGQIIDAPGAVLVTSTRTDVLEQTGPLRARKGPVYVFNPVGLGLLKSSITFDPLTGCESPVTAAERAADMIAAGNMDTSGDRKFWDDLARINLAALLHAAALGDQTMMDVRQWVSNPKAHEPLIVSLLSESPEPAFEAAIAQFINTNDRTQSSITMTISPALAWLTHAPARAAAHSGSKGGHPFDVADLRSTRASVYMLGGTEAQVAPLVAALTGHIARQARQLATAQPGGRLDPPLSLRLDEAALICPIPLHEWSADMGGRGVSIVACFQSRAQIIDRYGPAKAATILNNAGGIVLYGGTTDRDDLQFWSTLAGERG